MTAKIKTNDLLKPGDVAIKHTYGALIHQFKNIIYTLTNHTLLTYQKSINNIFDLAHENNLKSLTLPIFNIATIKPKKAAAIIKTKMKQYPEIKTEILIRYNPNQPKKSNNLYAQYKNLLPNVHWGNLEDTTHTDAIISSTHYLAQKLKQKALLSYTTHQGQIHFKVKAK